MTFTLDAAPSRPQSQLPLLYWLLGNVSRHLRPDDRSRVGGMNQARTTADRRLRADLDREAPGTAADYNVPALMVELHTLADGWNFDKLDDPAFWTAVARHRVSAAR